MSLHYARIAGVDVTQAHETADPLHPSERPTDRDADRRGRGAERNEDDREAEDEQRCVEHRTRSSRRQPVRIRQLIQRHPRDERQVARHQRNHARRQERHEPGTEGQAERDVVSVAQLALRLCSRRMTASRTTSDALEWLST